MIRQRQHLHERMMLVRASVAHEFHGISSCIAVATLRVWSGEDNTTHRNHTIAEDVALG